MRHKLTPQMDIFHIMGKNEIAKELQHMSEILDANPSILERVYKDLTRDCRADTGRSGMTAEHVLRSGVLKQYRSLTYEELAFHLEDSRAFRSLPALTWDSIHAVRFIQENIKAISDATWEAINRIIIDSAATQKIETGRKVRVDATAVETNIHEPTDSKLLYDGVRIITRWLKRGKSLTPTPGYGFCDHGRVMKKRLIAVLNSKKEEQRVRAYNDMLRYARLVTGYGEAAMETLASFTGKTAPDTLKAKGICEKIRKALELLKKVIDQTERRVFKGENVPAGEKVLSFFEPHTDIIRKSNRDTEYGHKVFFAAGSSSLILDCLIERGNPSDSTRYMPMLNRQKDVYGRMPRQTSADGGFASKENLTDAKEAGVKDAAFSKKRGLNVLDMVKSNWVYRQLRNFRAGIEANISTLKRSFGLKRCNWTGWEGFRQYVWSSVVSYNLLVLARLKMKAA